MELKIKEYAATWKGQKRMNRDSLSLIRYADDFVIIHEDLNVIKNCHAIVGKFLADFGLEYSQEKNQNHTHFHRIRG